MAQKGIDKTFQTFVMKKQSYLIIAIGLLGIILWLYYRNDGISTIGRIGKYFEIRDTATVDWIIIEGDSRVELKRKDNIWLINDEWQADQMAMNNFLFVFNRLRIRGIAGDAGVEKDDPGYTIWIGENKKTRVMHNYSYKGMDVMHKEGAERYFFAEVAGFPDIKLQEVINDNPYFWRNRLLFSFRPEEIAEVSLHYPESPRKDFTILNAGDSILIYDPVDNYFYPGDKVNKEKLRMFISYFINVFFDEFLVETHRRDSVLNLSPDIQINIESTDGKSKRIDIWPVYNGEERDERFIYLRADNDHEILLAKHILTDLWGKEKDDFLLN